MATESKAMEALRGKIRTYSRQKRVSHEVDYEDGTITARRGSTIVIIKPMEWGERTLVKLVAPVVLSVARSRPISPASWLRRIINSCLASSLSTRRMTPTPSGMNMCYSATPWTLRNCPSQ